MYKLGLDIGGTKINIGILDSDYQLLAVKKLYISEVFDPLSQIRSATQELCCKCGIPYQDIISCGVGVPGTVSADGKTLIKAPNISILSEDFAIKLEKELGMPVFMMQDSRAAALGEYLCGAGRGAKTLVCITLGTGVGSGIVIDGKIYNGALGAAGEIGHIPVVVNGRPCGCGQSGCMEKYCAGRGLDITAQELYGQDKDASFLFDCAEQGDMAAQEALNQAIVLLGNALVFVVNLLSPDCILFTGGLSERTKQYVNPVIDYVCSHCYCSGQLPRMQKAALAEYAPLIGAALGENA